ncbi:MAG: glycosyltransferase [Bacteroidales bacterium]|nr:glycosyltransferase [Bacteroidales bacterium]
MLSVCIPVYNQPVAPLLKALLAQFSTLGQSFEILLADDCSTPEIQRMNAADCPDDSHIHWLQPGGKMGRAALRNFLGDAAQYEWILFMDCDVLIDNQEYINNYLKHFPQADVLVGGCAYQATPPAADRLLRWSYGRQREMRPAELRNQHPYASFSSFNFCIKKEVFRRCRFDVDFHDYGHEDTLFGLQLQAFAISVLHIDNPLIHTGLTENAAYLSQSLEAVRKFLCQPVFRQAETIAAIKILRWYQYCCRWGLKPLLRGLWNGFHPSMAWQLCGPAPKMRLFDLYRLSYLCSLDPQVVGQEYGGKEVPLISVIVPYYNREACLPACLESIRIQRLRPLELILVDNCSQDGSAAVCRQFQQANQSDDFRIVLLEEPRQGACKARNAGLKAASGQYVLCFDSDDVMRRDYLKRLRRILGHMGAPQLLACRFRTDRGQLLPKHMRFDAAQQLIDPVVMTHNVCLRRSLLDTAGCWNERLDRWQDLEFGFRLLLHASSKRWINEALYTVNTSADAISARSWSDDADKLLASLEAIRQDIAAQPEAERPRLTAAWCFKLVSLAASLYREDACHRADDLYCQALSSLPDSHKKYRLLLAAHYGYTKRGGRGFWRLAAAAFH